jgi:hypothetical protein
VAGGERWSVARGKECPGDNRIDRITSTVIPRVRGILDRSGERITGDEHTADLALMACVTALYEDRDGLMNRDRSCSTRPGRRRPPTTPPAPRWSSSVCSAGRWPTCRRP